MPRSHRGGFDALKMNVQKQEATFTSGQTSISAVMLIYACSSFDRLCLSGLVSLQGQSNQVAIGCAEGVLFLHLIA